MANLSQSANPAFLAPNRRQWAGGSGREEAGHVCVCQVSYITVSIFTAPLTSITLPGSEQGTTQKVSESRAIHSIKKYQKALFVTLFF